MGHWHFAFFKWRFLKFVQQCLTVHWGTLQGGWGQEALALWHFVFLVLELDRKSQLDLMLLAHVGEAGRAKANEILWNLLSIWSLEEDYLDLSHKVTSKANNPEEHRPPPQGPQ